jgi:hypothetical protein
MNIFLYLFFIVACSIQTTVTILPPAGLFLPYDINIKQKKPAVHNLQLIFLGENSYHIQGYATDFKEEKTKFVNALQIYEPTQNVVSMYQGYGVDGTITQTLTTPFTQLLDSIAGGAGGGVSNLQNGIFKPSAKMSAGQFSTGATFGLGSYFYISAYLPFYFTKLSHINWLYDGNNSLFSNEKIQEELINSFSQDSLKYFDLNVGNWKRNGVGDLAIIAEWQRDFPQQKRRTLRCVQTNARLGITFPTAKKNCQNVIMPIDFGADGAFSIPFGGQISMNLANIFDIGFSGQFWYFMSNQKIRRIKTFPTQTTLLLPTLAQTHKEFGMVQNFNLFGTIYSSSKRFSLKGLYEYWRKGKDTLTPISSNFNFVTVNSSFNIDEESRHQFCVMLMYSPLKDDFKRFIPQFEIFWKESTNGMRTIAASTYGAQLSIIF